MLDVRSPIDGETRQGFVAFLCRIRVFANEALFDGFFTSKQWQPPEDALLEEPAAPAKKVATASTLHRQPVLVDAPRLDGPIGQGLEWEDQTLLRDEDGDEAHGFICCDPLPAGRRGTELEPMAASRLSSASMRHPPDSEMHLSEVFATL